MRTFFYSIMSGKKKGIFSLIFKMGFAFLSFFYLISFGILKRLYKFGIIKTYKANSKIISVGNITIGGTGKTPFVNMLAEQISLTGRRVAILMRGYGDDEAELLKQNLPQDIPILVEKNRIKNIQAAGGIDTFILDDGFQYIKLFRDLDIVLIDATCPFGNGFVLPAGILREPISNLKRAHIIVLTKTDLGRANLDKIKQKLLRISSDTKIFEAVHRPLYFTEAGKDASLRLDELKTKRVCLVSGIADNESFYNTVKSLGIDIKETFFFSDHYPYTLQIIEGIIKRCTRLSLDAIITTQKDYVRIKKVMGNSLRVEGFKIRMFLLHVKLEIKDEQQEEFKRRVSSIYPG